MYQLCFFGIFILICSEVAGYFLYFLGSNLNLEVGQSLTELLLVDERVWFTMALSDSQEQILVILSGVD